MNDELNKLAGKSIFIYVNQKRLICEHVDLLPIQRADEGKCLSPKSLIVKGENNYFFQCVFVFRVVKSESGISE